MSSLEIEVFGEPSFRLLPSALSSSQDSQNSDLNEDDLNQMVEESEPDTTKKNMSWGMNKFNKWLEKRQIVVDLKTVSEEKLNEILVPSFRIFVTGKYY